MAVRLPEKITDVNIFIDGVGHLGTSEEVKLPEINQKFDSVTAGGFEREVPTGILEKLEAEISLTEYSPIAFAALAANFKGVPTVFFCKANIVQDGVKKGVVATITGDISVNDGSLKAGETAKRTIKVKVRQYLIEINGLQGCFIDVDNIKAIIDGVDVLEEVRKNLM